MRWFHAFIHATVPNAVVGPPLREDGAEYRTLSVGDSVQPPPLDCSFEQAQQRLQALPRLFIEPDGSFVWRGTTETSPWQLDGQLYDHAGRLTHVELSGEVSRQPLDQVLTCIGWPGQRLMFQLPRQGVYLDEAEFRRYVGH